jgi:hypothetical protein
VKYVTTINNDPCLKGREFRMTKTSVINGFFSTRPAGRLKKKILALTANFKKPKYDYPLYWLAPAIDRGLKYVKVATFLKEDTPGHKGKSNIFHFPWVPGPLKGVLSLIGLGLRGGKAPHIRIARIDGQFMVERGHFWMRLAALLGLDYIRVKVVEYDFGSLKKRMHILKQPNGALVGVSGGRKGRCSYYGIYPAQLDVLVRCHRVPCEDQTVITVREPAVGMGTVRAPAGKAAKKRSNLVLFKK